MVTVDDLRLSANVWDVHDALAVSRGLQQRGFVIRETDKDGSCFHLSDRGLCRLADLRKFWRQPILENPVVPPIFHCTRKKT
jgi:hypothetical protein